MAKGKNGVEKVDSQIEMLADTIYTDIINSETDWQAAWSFDTPFNPLSNTVYKGKNVLLLLYAMRTQGWTDPRFMTYRQAAEAGLHVRKNEHSYAPIEYWEHPGWFKRVASKYGKSKQERVPDPKTKAEEDEYSNNPNISWHPWRLCGCYDMFNAAQIEGIEPYVKPDRGIDFSTIDILEKHAFCPVKEVYGQSCYYTPMLDHVVVPTRGQYNSAECMAHDMLHELSHATGHPSRLKRPQEGRFGSEDYAKEELVAEIGSLLCAHELGILAEFSGTSPNSENYTQSIAYLKSWLKKLENPKARIREALGDAKKASDLICKQYVKPIEELRQQQAQSTPATVVSSDTVTIANAERTDVEVTLGRKLTMPEYFAWCFASNDPTRYKPNVELTADSFAKMLSDCLPVDKIIASMMDTPAMGKKVLADVDFALDEAPFSVFSYTFHGAVDPGLIGEPTLIKETQMCFVRYACPQYKTENELELAYKNFRTEIENLNVVAVCNPNDANITVVDKRTHRNIVGANNLADSCNVVSAAIAVDIFAQMMPILDGGLEQKTALIKRVLTKHKAEWIEQPSKRSETAKSIFEHVEELANRIGMPLQAGNGISI